MSLTSGNQSGRHRDFSFRSLLLVCGLEYLLTDDCAYVGVFSFVRVFVVVKM